MKLASTAGQRHTPQAYDPTRKIPSDDIIDLIEAPRLTPSSVKKWSSQC